MQRITTWNPEDESFWESEGKRHANRNLWISIPALFLSFVVWQIWSVVAVKLNDVGFDFSSSQLFTLAALPGLVGATLRIVFTFMPGIFGGRNWTVISTAALLIPTIGIGFAVKNPDTSFAMMALLAALCGIGGGNFSSSMANIAYFFPKKSKGTANGLNAGIGNLGVSAVQFVTSVIITTGAFAGIFGAGQLLENGTEVWIQNAAFIWVVPIVIVSILAFFGMDNLPDTKQSLKEQAVIFKNKHTWIMSVIYTMCFGSFIGFGAAFPLLLQSEFPKVDALNLTFLGPLVGASARPVGGWIADKLGGARVTFWDTIAMIVGTIAVLFFLEAHHFVGFLITFIFLFLASGIANGSTFRMIPFIFEPKQASPVLGFTAAIAAYGAYIVPKVFSWSINSTGAINTAFYIFLVYYVISLAMTWYYYSRKNAPVKC